MHNIQYFTYPKDCNKKKVQAELDDFVAHEDWQEGVAGLGSSIRWFDSKTYDSYDEAVNAIERLDSGWYDNLAVLYNEPQVGSDSKVKLLQETIIEKHDEYEKRNAVLYANTVTSAFIGCKDCGSKLARTKLKTNRCPVCGNDLRPNHMLKSVETAKKKWQKAVNDLEEHKKKHCKKIVKWLVKIEYHT